MSTSALLSPAGGLEGAFQTSRALFIVTAHNIYGRLIQDEESKAHLLYQVLKECFYDEKHRSILDSPSLPHPVLSAISPIENHGPDGMYITPISNPRGENDPAAEANIPTRSIVLFRWKVLCFEVDGNNSLVTT